MNPNSRNQIWSRWTFTVTPKVYRRPEYETVKLLSARFARKLFGRAGEMQVTEKVKTWEFDIRVEGHPVHDPEFVDYIRTQWELFFGSHFGSGTDVHLHARLEAGSRQDGTPPDQLVILPGISIN